MKDLNELAVLACLSDCLSFEMTAKRLGLSASTVSRRIASLETRLGVALVRRTTRSVRMTSAGQTVARQCQAMVNAAERVEALAQAESEGLKGELSVNAPTLFGRLVLPSILFEFANRHRDVRLRLSLNNHRVDLEADNVDLVIRTGALPDSALRAKPLLLAQMVVVAAPACAARNGGPKALTDFAQLPCIAYDRAGDVRWICPAVDGAIPVDAVFVANDNEVVRDAALAGIGFAMLPRFVVQSAIKDGRLVVIPLTFELGATPVSLVFPSHKIVNRCADALASMIVKALRHDPAWR